MYSIELSRQAEKFIEKTDEKTRLRIREIISRLETTPVPVQFYDVCKIVGSDADYRIRIGRIRIQYTVYWENKQLKIAEIDRRKDRTYK